MPEQLSNQKLVNDQAARKAFIEDALRSNTEIDEQILRKYSAKELKDALSYDSKSDSLAIDMRKSLQKFINENEFTSLQPVELLQDPNISRAEKAEKISGLLERDSEIWLNSQDIDGRTALAAAAYKGYSDVVTILIDQGADLNIKDDKGNTALTIAIESGYNKVAEQLINNHADLNIQNKKGESALIIALQNNQTDLAKQLIDKGADLNLQNEKGESALDIALNRKQTKIVEQLTSKGADQNLQNEKGQSALMIALRNGQTEIIDKLIESRVPIANDLITVAAALGNIKIVQTLIEKKVDLNLQDNHGDTALVNAARHGKTEIVTELLNNGANINIQNKSGNNALIEAVANGQTEIVKELIITNATIDNKQIDSISSSNKDVKHCKDLLKIKTNLEKQTDKKILKAFVNILKENDFDKAYTKISDDPNFSKYIKLDDEKLKETIKTKVKDVKENVKLNRLDKIKAIFKGEDAVKLEKVKSDILKVIKESEGQQELGKANIKQGISGSQKNYRS